MKRSLSLLTLVMMLAALLAACGAQQGGAPAPAATPPPADATAPTGGTTEGAPSDPIGVIEIGPGDPIVIAYALVTTGPNASLGEDSRRGVELAIDDAGGTLLGRSIELIGEDTGCSAEGGQAAATKLASNTDIVAIVGTSCSSEARVLAPVIDRAGMVMVSPSNTAPDLTAQATHVNGYLRTAHNDQVQGRVAAEFAFNGMNFTRVATIHDGSPYAEGLVNVFSTVFRELGGEVVAQEAINVGDTDMSPVLNRIASSPGGAPDLIYYPIFVAEGGFITNQVRSVAGLENAALMGADGIFSPDFIQAAGASVQGMYLSSPDFSAFGGGYSEFLQKYEAKFGEKPTAAFHAHSYDATRMILAAIEAVAVEGADGTLYIPRQGLRDALYATSGFQGLTGSLSCGENGDCGAPVIAVYEVVNTDPASWNPGTADDSNPKKIYP